MVANLPVKARWYILFTIVCAFLGLFFEISRINIAKIDIFAIFILTILAYYAGKKTISISSGGSKNEIASISIGFLIILFSLLNYGCLYGLFCAISSIAFSSIKTTKIYQYIFNISALIVTVLLTSWFLKLSQVVGFDVGVFTSGNFDSLFPMLVTMCISIASVLLYHFLNAALITGAVALSMKWDCKRSVRFFTANTLWIAPVYLAASCFIILIIWVVKNLEINPVGTMPLCFVIIPLPIMFFHNLKLHRERDVERETRFSELEKLYSSMVQAMGRAIEAKDKYTQEHISRVVAISMGIGNKIGLSPTDLRSLEVGAALHDIGKIAIPEDILNKPGKLTQEEFLLVQEHAALGSQILQPVPFPPQVVEAVRHHHEKWDGTGYPDRLAGNDIPLVARIVAVADVYDALTSDRPYRAAWSHERAMSFLREQVGRHFDSYVFEAFEAAMIAQPELRTTAVDLPLPEEPLPAKPLEEASPARKAA